MSGSRQASMQGIWFSDPCRWRLSSNEYMSSLSQLVQAIEYTHYSWRSSWLPSSNAKEVHFWGNHTVRIWHHTICLQRTIMHVRLSVGQTKYYFSSRQMATLRGWNTRQQWGKVLRRLKLASESLCGIACHSPLSIISNTHGDTTQ